MIWKDEDGFLESIKNEKKFGIFLDMGTGKTALLLALTDEKIFNQGVKKILIVAPKKVSKGTWQSEMEKWDNFRHLKSIVKLINGEEEARKEMLENVSEYAIHIVSSSIFRWLIFEEVIKFNKNGKMRKKFVSNSSTPHYDMVIIDECSQFKDPKSDRYKALEKMKPEQLFLLSGTPFPNVKFQTEKSGFSYYTKGNEFFYALHFLDIYTKSYYEFCQQICFSKPWQQYSYFISTVNHDAIYKSLAEKSIRKKMYLKVPIYHHKIYCGVSEKEMKSLVDDYYLILSNSKEIDIDQKAQMINKALQLANGFVYHGSKLNRVSERINFFKFKKLKEITDQLILKNENAIIAYVFQEDKQYLLQNLKGSVEYIDDTQKDLWNQGKIRFLIISPSSERYGLNFQFGGRVMIWFGVVWSGESFSQTIARIYRRGQEKPVHIYYLLAENSYDDYVFDTVTGKIEEGKNFLEYTQSLRGGG